MNQQKTPEQALADACEKIAAVLLARLLIETPLNQQQKIEKLYQESLRAVKSGVWKADQVLAILK